MQNKFTEKAQNTLTSAQSSARELGHTYIGSEHILLGLMSQKDSIGAKLLRMKGADIDRFRDAVIAASGIGSPSHVTPDDMTPRAKQIIEASAKEAARFESKYIGTEHILYALLSQRDCVASRLLQSEGVSHSELISELNAYICSGSSKQAKQGQKQDQKSTADDKTKIRGAPMISTHGKDLTAIAREGRLDPTVGREKETERVIRILSRRTKNNPCLIGEPGVGKTAVVEGLAARIAEKNVPEALIDKRIITLNIPSMIAGAKYRGEFEDRMKSVIEEAEKNPDIILFVDEIHVIIGAGAAEGAVDAANIIKPALARGQLRMIGATTISEYRSRIERDAALERRFQAVNVGEPTEDEALTILRGLRERYEKHHKLKISDGALTAAVKFSSRYIPDRFLPDKAIDLVDEAASKLCISSARRDDTLSRLENELERLLDEKRDAVKHQNFQLAAQIRKRELDLRAEIDGQRSSVDTESDTLPTVTEADIADVVTEWTGIPVSRILEDEGRRLLSLEERLGRRVIGQDEAIERVCRAIRRGRIGLKDPSRPIGSFIFIGQSGVGKTRLSKAIAEELFGSSDAVIRLDMSEYMEKHSVSRLIGSPPGYVGYEEGGQLTERIRRRPYSVVLFDEIEKAHPEVFNLLLQLLEDGVLTDSRGRRASFSNSIIIMTSNAGTSHKRQSVFGFSDASRTDSAKELMSSALKSTFRPEFLNRVDDVIYFNELGADDAASIATEMLSEVEERAMSVGVRVAFDKTVCELIVKEHYDHVGGARGMRRAITRLVEDGLSEEILSGRICASDQVTAFAHNGSITFKKE